MARRMALRAWLEIERYWPAVRLQTTRDLAARAETDADPSLVAGSAGWDPLQQATALSTWYTEIVEHEGWPAERLVPLLAGLLEFLPWLEQWHKEVDPQFGQRMGEFFGTFLDGQLHRHGLTREDLKAWEPPQTRRRKRRRATG